MPRRTTHLILSLKTNALRNFSLCDWGAQKLWLISLTAFCVVPFVLLERVFFPHFIWTSFFLISLWLVSSGEQKERLVAGESERRRDFGTLAIAALIIALTFNTVLQQILNN